MWEPPWGQIRIIQEDDQFKFRKEFFLVKSSLDWASSLILVKLFIEQTMILTPSWIGQTMFSTGFLAVVFHFLIFQHNVTSQGVLGH